MTKSGFISTLDPSEQEILSDESLSFEEKIGLLGYLISDKNVLEKCRNHLESKVKLDEYLAKVPVEHKETVTAIVTDDDLNRASKLIALRQLWNNKEFLEESVKFIKQLQTTKEKQNDIWTLLPVDIPFLTELPEEIREDLKTLIHDNMITIDRKLQGVDNLVTEKSLRKKCRRFLKKLQTEICFLSQFPVESRSEVAAILREPALSLEERIYLLKYALKKQKDRKRCREYMKQNEPVPEYEDDGTPTDINFDFLEKAPDEMNVLILGETGVGKSTFINGMANYLKHRNMHSARNHESLEILITSYFTHTDDNFKQEKIVCRAEDGGNENLEDGKSSTLAAQTYVFKWGVEGKKKKIRLIDTPGVGDVAGFVRDKQNFDNIFSHLADYKELHGICVLLKPNESKLNTTFTYCLGELLSRLHKSALKNLLFCFTNTRNTLYRPGETSAILTSYLKDIEETRKIQIPLNKASMFCFDNESFRFLCAWKNGVKFSERHVDDFNGSWKRSVREVFRFFNRVSQLRPHNVTDTLCVNNVRTVYNILARPMADLHTKQNTIDKVIKEKNDEMIKVSVDIDTLSSKLSRDKTTTVRKYTNRIDTVCGSTCSHFDPVNATEKRYRVCHSGCNCVRAPKLETYQQVSLQQCACINKQTLHCSCGCFWSAHMQISYDLVQGTEKVVDTAVQNKIQLLQAQKAKLTGEIAQAQQRKTAAGADNQRLGVQGTEFVAYLMKNAILSYNVHKKDYLEKLIKEEKQHVGQGKPDKTLRELENYQEQHSHQVALLDACKEDSSKTALEMEQMITAIKESKNGGVIQSEIDNMILLKPRSRPMIRSKEVDLNDGWIGEYLEQIVS